MILLWKLTYYLLFSSRITANIYYKEISDIYLLIYNRIKGQRGRSINLGVPQRSFLKSFCTKNKGE